MSAARLANVIICVVVITAVGLQRIEIAGTGIPVVLPIFATAVAALVAIGAVKFRERAVIPLLALTVCFAVTAAIWVVRDSFQVNNAYWLMVLVLIWGPFALRPSAGSVFRPALAAFVMVNTVGAIAACAQFAANAIGFGFIDPIGLLPQELLLDGYLVTSPVSGVPGLSELQRSNGFFYLEPSLASQFFAIAATLIFRSRPLLAALYLVALATTFSGTGLIALILSVLALIIVGSARERIIGIAIIVGGFIAVNTGLGSILADRSSEFTTANTSGSIRFLAPWEHLAHFVQEFEVPLIGGFGPGAAGGTYAYTDTPVNYILPVQVSVEYGLLFGAIFVAAIVTAVVRTSLPLSTRLAILAVTFLLSGTLYQAFSAAAIWPLVMYGASRIPELSRRAGLSPAPVVLGIRS